MAVSPEFVAVPLSPDEEGDDTEVLGVTPSELALLEGSKEPEAEVVLDTLTIPEDDMTLEDGVFEETVMESPEEVEDGGIVGDEYALVLTSVELELLTTTVNFGEASVFDVAEAVEK